MSFGSIVYLIYYIYDRIFQACYLNLKWPNAHAHRRLTFTSLCNMHHHIPALPTKVNPISTLSGLSSSSTNNVLECPVTIWGCDLLMKFRARVSDRGFSGSILPSTGPYTHGSSEPGTHTHTHLGSSGSKQQVLGTLMFCFVLP